MGRYFMNPKYWIKLAVMSLAFLAIKKFAPHGYAYYMQMVALVLIWGFNPERYLIRMVRRLF